MTWMFSPRGVWRLGLLRPEKSAREGHLVGPIMCIGPVSFPMAAAAFFANAAIWNKDVRPVKLMQFGQISMILSVASFSAFVPSKTTWCFCFVSCVAISAKNSAGQRLCGCCGAHPGTSKI